ncbi:HAD family hydrolase [Paenibacillus allorhizosphaerae]|uniref:Pyrophosphatase PpaX n=1 Tax=Paenibacillus allorhizosphaerae TaxID=2849866 RepID=A0ABM8VFW0_9BACL|nr:HAD family hydrolase [Paenibacillus allorhizosphaerae]CAG7636222.1 Pyrophosphatase PpaX [Paenibacillus allorhizosphaerae]
MKDARQIDTLLFDLDGTLLDSRDFLIQASYETMEAYFPGACPYDYIQKHFGIGFAHYLPKERSPLREEALRRFFTLKMNHYHEKSTVFPGVIEGLKALKDNRYKLGIVTNQQKAVTEKALQAFGMADLFDIVIAIEDVSKGKPDPEGIEQAMRAIGAAPETTAMAGDSAYDLLAARHAGVASVYLTWYENMETLDECGPDWTCTSLEQLRAVLGNKA